MMEKCGNCGRGAKKLHRSAIVRLSSGQPDMICFGCAQEEEALARRGAANDFRMMVRTPCPWKGVADMAAIYARVRAHGHAPAIDEAADAARIARWNRIYGEAHEKEEAAS